jgi:hypothetical protein
MDCISSSSLHGSKDLNYFPSAVPESPGSTVPFQPEGTSGKSSAEEREMTIILNIGPSREPAPLMRYEFHKSSNARRDEGASHELIIKSKRIQAKFSNLILDVCTLLQDSPSAQVNKLQMWLSFQSCSKSVQSLQAFEGGSEATKAKTIPAFISSLHCYTSWYNYDLIADVARHFCPEKGATLVTAYEAELRDYMQRLIVHCPPLFPDYQEVSQSQIEVLDVKIGGWDVSTAVLEDLALFKHTFCQLCDLDPRFLIIRELNATTFKMSWAVPKSATGMLEKVIKLKSDTLHHKNNIQTIKMGDLDIDFQEVGIMHALYNCCTFISYLYVYWLQSSDSEVPGLQTGFEKSSRTRR